MINRKRRLSHLSLRRAGAMLAAAMLLTGTAKAPAPPPVKAADVLVWTQAERQGRFPHMEKLLPHRVVHAGGRVHPLPKGKPLAISLTKDGKPQTLNEWMAADRTAGLIVLQDGRIRLERYGPTLKPTGHWAGFSVTKSITSTLYGAAIADGAIKSLGDGVTTYLPELKGSAYDGVSLKQLLTMSSGVRWIEDYNAPNSDAARMYTTPADPGLDPITSYMRRLPREAAPGTKWNYKTGETDLAGILLIRATGKSMSDYLSEKVWRPYGMQQDGVWMLLLRSAPRLCPVRPVRAGWRRRRRQAGGRARLARRGDPQRDSDGAAGAGIWLFLVAQCRWHL
jgi:CubicO group peptidase (beta-lactamase class C family)